MNIITVNNGSFTPENLCCAVTSKKSAQGLIAKYEWIKERTKDGLIFKKSADAGNSGKVFIEYIPAEKAWAPVISNNCMHINCLWVSGRFAGHGYAKKLLESCEQDTLKAGLKGITALCTVKKSPYMNDYKFYRHMGFEVADEYRNYMLMIKPLASGAEASFSKTLGNTWDVSKEGFHVFYTNQCPFTEYYAQTEAMQKAENEFIPYFVTKISSLVEAKNACIPWTTYGAFYNGEYIGHEIISNAYFDKLIKKFK